MTVARGLYSHNKDGATGLTGRQSQVLELMKQGLDQAAIAKQLGVSRQRVRQIVEALLKKGMELEGVKTPDPGSWTRRQAATE